MLSSNTYENFRMVSYYIYLNFHLFHIYLNIGRDVPKHVGDTIKEMGSSNVELVFNLTIEYIVPGKYAALQDKYS
jgi:hypothetical protein